MFQAFPRTDFFVAYNGARIPVILLNNKIKFNNVPGPSVGVKLA